MGSNALVSRGKATLPAGGGQTAWPGKGEAERVPPLINGKWREGISQAMAGDSVSRAVCGTGASRPHMLAASTNGQFNAVRHGHTIAIVNGAGRDDMATRRELHG